MPHLISSCPNPENTRPSGFNRFVSPSRAGFLQAFSSLPGLFKIKSYDSKANLVLRIPLYQVLFIHCWVPRNATRPMAVYYLVARKPHDLQMTLEFGE